MGLDFVSHAPDHLLCSICQEVFSNAQTTNCGHTFCFECLSKHNQRNKTCPVCREPQTTEPAPNHVVRDMVGVLEVKCPNRCPAVLQVQNVAIHIRNDCPNRLVSCTNKGCTVQHAYHNRSHAEECDFREVQCALGCGQTLLARDVDGHLCPNQPTLCPRGCGETVLQQDLKSHHAVCLFEPLKCTLSACHFQAERGATDVWAAHNADFAYHHALLERQTIEHANAVELQLRDWNETFEQQRGLIWELQRQLGNYQQSMQKLQQENAAQWRMLEPLFSTTWVVHDIQSHENVTMVSPELCFDRAPDPQLRHHFAIKLEYDHTTGIRVSLVNVSPHSGEKERIENHVRISAKSAVRGLAREKVFDSKAAQQFFLERVPRKALGAKNKLIPVNEIQDFLDNGSLHLQVTLLPTHF